MADVDSGGYAWSYTWFLVGGPVSSLYSKLNQIFRSTFIRMLLYFAFRGELSWIRIFPEVTLGCESCRLDYGRWTYPPLFQADMFCESNPKIKLGEIG